MTSAEELSSTASLSEETTREGEGTEGPQLLSYSYGDSDEIILRILMGLQADGRYSAQLSEAGSGSESDTGGPNPAEVVGSALEWAGISGFSAPATASVAEIREQLIRSIAASDVELEVEIYSSF